MVDLRGGAFAPPPAGRVTNQTPAGRGLKVKIRRFHLLRSGDGAINHYGPKTRQRVFICRYGEGASNKVKSHTKEMRVAMER